MTQKQILAAKSLVKNGGNVSKAMIAAGYSPMTAKTPQKLTESKAWPELLEKYLPDNVLLTTHAEALTAEKWNDFTGEREPDFQTRLKAVDLGYKVKGKINNNFFQQFVGGEMKVEFN